MVGIVKQLQIVGLRSQVENVSSGMFSVTNKISLVRLIFSRPQLVVFSAEKTSLRFTKTIMNAKKFAFIPSIY